MSEVTDTFIIMGIQDIKQIANWNPIFIDIISSLIPFLDFVLKYPPSRFIYRFRLTKNSNSRNKNIIKFKKEEVKIPHFNFAIDAIYS